MKDSYTIHFDDGTERTFTPSVKIITNRVRAAIAKFDVAQYAADMSVLNGILRTVLANSSEFDFSDAVVEDTDAVVLDFFGLFNAKTN